jgi:hypothetical protein
VEFARELVDIARANLAKMQTTNAVVIHADAAEFQFPDEDLVVYLYNPFSQDVMEKVVANMRERRCRKLCVIYVVPECAEVLDSCGFLSRLGAPPVRRYIQIWVRSSAV